MLLEINTLAEVISMAVGANMVALICAIRFQFRETKGSKIAGTISLFAFWFTFYFLFLTINYYFPSITSTHYIVGGLFGCYVIIDNNVGVILKEINKSNK